MKVHVVSTNTVLVHCQLLPSSAIDTGVGAAAMRKATQASVNVAITSARLLPVHLVPAIAVAPVRNCADNRSGARLSFVIEITTLLFVNCSKCAGLTRVMYIVGTTALLAAIRA